MVPPSHNPFLAGVQTCNIGSLADLRLNGTKKHRKISKNAPSGDGGGIVAFSP